MKPRPGVRPNGFAAFARTLLVLAAWPAAATAQEAPRPPVTPGDRWSFVVYYGTPSTAPNRHWVVSAVSPQGIAATENGEPLQLSPDLNLVESPARRESDLRLLQFPLSVGKRWTFETDTLFKDNQSTARTGARVEVVAHETVRVVAGEFAAFRLEASGSFTGRSKGGPGVLSGEFRSTYWYAPAARAIVKSETWSTYRGAVTVELVRFEPSGSAGR
ncbi:MAG: hypothetical protein ACLGIT_15880 [Gammaproteobacteria bacterium]|uniref:hypothetical protein n=1 Tax=Azohydromonas sp. TaxID=1872666 RepID=UPI002CDC945C|nr:hypothetical protein [Azohydromonas sp.]HMM87164.1 hypothetical protein [Azohydromonas sp.]